MAYPHPLCPAFGKNRVLSIDADVDFIEHCCCGYLRLWTPPATITSAAGRCQTGVREGAGSMAVQNTELKGGSREAC